MLAVFSQETVTANNSNLGGRIIIIDAGHGGADHGSTACDGLYEKDANLDIAYKLEALLKAEGATVGMPRTDDSYLTNADRYTYANEKNGEVLVSIHLNGSEDKTVNGTLGLYSKWRKDKEFTSILHNSLVDELNTEALPVPDLEITNFMSGVTMRFNGPATIQEAVYISNTDECTALKDGGGSRQQQIADSLYNGLDDWFSEEREFFISPGQLK